MGILRLLLAISVVIAHSSKVLGFGIVGGQIAVQVFFIISGFYMTLILNEKYIGNNNSYKLFISNRLLRLYPIYWVVLLLTIILSIFMLISSEGVNSGRLKVYIDHFDSINLFSAFFIGISNIILLFQDLVLFLGVDITTGSLFFTSNFQQTSPQLHNFLFVPQAWTIGLEITFYLIAPFIVTKKVKYVLGLIFASALIRFFLYQNGFKADPWTYRFFPSELMFFLFGTVAYHIYKKVDRLNLSRVLLFLIYIFIMVFTLFYSFISLEHKMIFYFLTFFLSLPFIFILTRNWTKDRIIGELSYPVYISHIFIIMLIHYYDIPKLGGLGFVAITLSIIFSVLLNEFISEPIERLRQKRLKPT